ncbi:MAG: hypothetical protein JXR37_37085 [Kiritimatiellae bacterium]|nr:hypothetical protein [Kiritimatiellia bacterium]
MHGVPVRQDEAVRYGPAGAQHAVLVRIVDGDGPGERRADRDVRAAYVHEVMFAAPVNGARVAQHVVRDPDARAGESAFEFELAEIVQCGQSDRAAQHGAGAGPERLLRRSAVDEAGGRRDDDEPAAPGAEALEQFDRRAVHAGNRRDDHGAVAHGADSQLRAVNRPVRGEQRLVGVLKADVPPEQDARDCGEPLLERVGVGQGRAVPGLEIPRNAAPVHRDPGGRRRIEDEDRCVTDSAREQLRTARACLQQPRIDRPVGLLKEVAAGAVAFGDVLGGVGEIVVCEERDAQRMFEGEERRLIGQRHAPAHEGQDLRASS